MPIQPLIPPPPPSWSRTAEAHATPAAAPKWQWSRLLQAPHRLGFFSGAFALALTALWWCTVLGLRAADVAVPWALSPSLGHGLLFAWGFMPLFIVGFLFTAGPRWLQVDEVSATELVPAVVVYGAGLALLILGVHAARWIAGVGVGAMAAAWFQLTLRYGKLWRQSRTPDKTHASVILGACLALLLGLLGSVVGMLQDEDLLVRLGIQLGLWWGVALVFVAVSHRMIPFFTASAVPVLDAWRPLWLLWCMVALLGWEGLGVGVDLVSSTLAPAWRWTQVVVESLGAALVLWLAVRWGLVQSLKIRLLAMLHGGFVWLGLTLTLYAWHHAWQALHGDTSPYALAPLHALTLGYLGATLFAMATRVAAGHSGRALAADSLAWTIYWVAQGAAAVRIVAVFLPHASVGVLLGAVLLWCTACCAWALRYGHWMGLPRLDGRPG